MTERAMAFRVAVPSWGVGTGGTRFARFAGPGEPRNVFEKLDDCETILRLVRVTPGHLAPHPWDEPDSPAELKAYAAARGLFVDSMNSNTFQDQPGQKLSYKFGSLTHADPAVRRQAVEHNVHCMELGVKLGARSHTVWIGDGGNFPGQMHFRRRSRATSTACARSTRRCRPASGCSSSTSSTSPRSTRPVLNDWGTSYYCTRELGERALSLVDLGHHAPERQHRDDRREADPARQARPASTSTTASTATTTSTRGSIKPFQLFLIFNELVDAELDGNAGLRPRLHARPVAQRHRPVESLMTSAVEVVRAYVQAHLVDREALREAQEGNDAVQALALLKQAFTTDVAPILATGAPARGRRDRPGGRVPRERLPQAQGRGAPGGRAAGRRHRLSHLAFDLGAGSGRAMLGRFSRPGLELRELHRFHYPPVPRDGHLRWPFATILAGVETGLARARAAASEPLESAGVCSWGVDYGLVDEAGRLVEDPIAYRDHRTDGAIERVLERLPRGEIFARTGLQFLQFNTLFQLDAHCARRTAPRGAAAADDPRPGAPRALRLDLRRVHERVDHAAPGRAHARVGRRALLPAGAAAGSHAGARSSPGTPLGELRPALREKLGIAALRVIAPPTHDTASAVAGTPARAGLGLPLLGHLVAPRRRAEGAAPGRRGRARELSRTRGGAAGTIRLLKNVMGLWAARVVPPRVGGRGPRARARRSCSRQPRRSSARRARCSRTTGTSSTPRA
jgi:L-rhamnose isomerase/sugar isomerase